MTADTQPKPATTDALTLYQVNHDGDVILYADRNGLPILVDVNFWTQSTDENFDPEEFVDIAVNTLHAIGLTPVIRTFDGNEMTCADGEEIHDTESFMEEMQAALDAHGNALPITSLPEIEKTG